MKETNFIGKNRAKWKNYEALLKVPGTTSPDQLATLYVVLTDDLAFARTHYPQSEIVSYINLLLSNIHLDIYRNKREKGSRFVQFWKYEVPLAVYSARRAFLISLLIFIAGFGIGLISTAHDEGFARLIMGEEYINMTLQNIEKGDPMAVYKSHESSEMFLAISINNIRVSFLAFIAGVFTSIGTGLILLRNAVMVGAFQYFFYEQGLLTESVLTIWIHGTLEISAIIIAGAAGIVFGNGILFPGTYPRIQSMRTAAVKGIKIVAGLIPIFIFAAFLEGYVTRLTEMPTLLKLFIIGTSLIFILFYFVYYPVKINRLFL
ncbi:MAG: stage II sporulation protein M [Cyclobacteriaceae bacterium]